MNAEQPLPTPAASRLQRWLNKLKRVKGPIVAIAGVGAVLSGLVGWYTTYKTVAATATSASAPGVDAINPLSILVLPFANQTGDTSKAYIADAITSSISSDLTRISDAYVVPAPTAFVYKDKQLTVKQVATDAGVRFVLHGTVLSTGDKLRISAQLTDAPSGAQLWSETFDGELSKLFALQDQITRRISASIGPEMVVAAGRESEKRSGKPKALDLMLRARAQGMRPSSLKNLQEMQVLYRQALTIDPNRVDAKIGLAGALSSAAWGFGSQLLPAQVELNYKEARDLALQAREADPDNPRVYFTLSAYAHAHDDHAGMRQAAETWYALQPKNTGAIAWMAQAHFLSGEPAKAIELYQQAMQLSPTRTGDVAGMVGFGYFIQGDYDKAIFWLLKNQQSVPAWPDTYALLAMTYTAKGDTAKSQAALADLKRVDPNFKVLNLDHPRLSSPQAFKDIWQQRVLPAARLAGVPE